MPRKYNVTLLEAAEVNNFKPVSLKSRKGKTEYTEIKNFNKNKKENLIILSKSLIDKT